MTVSSSMSGKLLNLPSYLPMVLVIRGERPYGLAL